MAITGLQAYKFLPRSNCKKCGYSTCLAYGMALASGKAELSLCPEAPEELKKLFQESLSTPVAEVKFGVPQLTVGAEKVLFRHEESFYHPTIIAPAIFDTDSDQLISERISQIEKLQFERAGSSFSAEAIYLQHTCARSLSDFLSLIPNRPIILQSSAISEIEECELLKKLSPLLYVPQATPEQLLHWIEKYSIPVILPYKFYGDPRFKLGQYLLLLEGDIKDQLERSITLRVEAICGKKSAPPVISLSHELSPQLQILNGVSLITRYCSVLTTSLYESEQNLPLMIVRQNIFSDPRKPIQVPAGLYPINSPDENSPLMVTTNFSLTHFLISSEAEASRVPSWVLAVDTDGTSLLTAWAADKFNGKRIAETLEKYEVFSSIAHRELIIGAYVASLKPDIEKRSDVKVIIAPAESSELSGWLKRNYTSI